MLHASRLLPLGNAGLAAVAQPGGNGDIVPVPCVDLALAELLRRHLKQFDAMLPEAEA